MSYHECSFEGELAPAKVEELLEVWAEHVCYEDELIVIISVFINFTKSFINFFRIPGKHLYGVVHLILIFQEL